MPVSIKIPTRPTRRFIPETFKVENWDAIKSYYENLLSREINTSEDLKIWLKDRSEIDSIVSEEMGWRYIKMTCNTNDEALVASFQYFVSEIEPHIAPFSNELNNKAVKSPFFKDLKGNGYDILRRTLEKDLKIFRSENIPLLTEMQLEAQKYGAISGGMTVSIEGKELTLQQASDFLMSTDRSTREQVYRKIQERRLQDKEQLDELYSKLINLRTQIAQNAGFENYRDYMFSALGRFDYTAKDCFNFHEAIASEVVPLLDEQAKSRKHTMNLAQLRPWDLKVDQYGKAPLVAFNSSEELIDKTIAAFYKLDPYLGNCLAIMKQMGHLDLASRKGKAPGGYNYPLAEIGVPFIFMNATSNLRDLVTMVHEGGHAVHSFLTMDLELNDFKNPPSEIAELASMSMELISMDHWDLFFDKPEDLKRAKEEQLYQIIETLPWVATIDKLQHWVYENPNHSIPERIESWNNIYKKFSDQVTDWSGLEQFRDYIWQKQLHLFEVPFYYIEYGMAQLGAIAVWKMYKEDRNAGLEGYKNALKLGYTKSIAEVYAAAGIKFDFSKEYVAELIGFVKEEIKKL